MKFWIIHAILLVCSFLFGKKINKDRIADFLISKYSGDTLEVKSYLAENFYNQHAPVIGLGINVAYKDDHLLVVDNFRKDSTDFFRRGDRIYEINNKIVSEETILPTGTIGSLQKVILTKFQDSSFSVVNVPLVEVYYKEKKREFLESIALYSKNWYDFDIDIEEIVIQKDKIVLTSKGYFWNYPGTKLSNKSISVLPEQTKERKPKCLGICSDYIKEYYDRYNNI